MLKRGVRKRSPFREKSIRRVKVFFLENALLATKAEEFCKKKIKRHFAGRSRTAVSRVDELMNPMPQE